MSTAQNKIAGAPISWGVCDVPGWGYQLPPDRVLDEMREIGLAATELGPEGFLPTAPEDTKRVARSLVFHYDVAGKRDVAGRIDRRRGGRSCRRSRCRIGRSRRSGRGRLRFSCLRRLGACRCGCKCGCRKGGRPSLQFHRHPDLFGCKGRPAVDRQVRNWRPYRRDIPLPQAADVRAFCIWLRRRSAAPISGRARQGETSDG